MELEAPGFRYVCGDAREEEGTAAITQGPGGGGPGRIPYFA